MHRFKLTIEYDGRPFVGWQRQANGRSVQQDIEEAIYRFSGEKLAISGAGRTDSGVHAVGQVAHVDLTRQWRPHQVREALNAHLSPAPISIIDVQPVDDQFDARFSAIRRHYLFRILNRRAPPSYQHGLVWHVRRELNVNAMNTAAQCLVGRHDFTTFRDAQCQAKSPIRTLDAITVSRSATDIEIMVSARSFLHRQVRSIVGSLEHVGSGRWTPEVFEHMFKSCDRSCCGTVAPPSGLYLFRVDYIGC